MKVWLISASCLACVWALPVAAQAPGAQDTVQTAASGAVSATALALTFGQTVDRARSRVQDAGAGTSAIEAEVASGLETDIIQSAAGPLVVQQALRRTLTDQSCRLIDREAGTWSRSGCAAIAELLTTVTAALGGPAAAGPTGGIPGTAAGAPPVSASGSDYAQD